MTEVNIKDLHPTSRNKIIEAKVYRSWIARDLPDTTEKGYRAILLDRKGDAIQANVEVGDKIQFTTYLIPGRAYRISGFTCIPTNKWQQTLENKTSLLITRFTKFDPIPPTGFPQHYFDFVAYNRLPYKVVDPQDKSRSQYPVLTDYIGCYIQSGEKEKCGNPNRDQMLIRRVEIQNLNRNSIELTLWDDLAESFPKHDIDALEKPVIMAVSSCRVSRFRNTLQLSSTPATYYYINPMILELKQYKAEYRALFDLNPPLQILRNPFQDKEQEKTRNRIPLAILLDQTPTTYAGVRFTCDGTITGVNTSREWYYPSCTSCTNKAYSNEGTFECRVHGPLVSPSYRYNFKAYITDTTVTVMITFFSPKADDIVGIDCDTLVKSLEDPDPRQFPEKILSIIGKKHIFQFHYNISSRQQPVDFIFNQILDNPDAPKQIADKPSGSTTIQESYQNIEMSIPQYQQTVAAIDYTATATATTNPETSLTPAPQEHDTPATEVVAPAQNYTYMQTRSRQGKQAITQSAGDTPPPTETPFTETSSKLSKEDSDKPPAAKRQLFQEKAPDAKKNKKE